MRPMKIAIGSDHAGFDLKSILHEHLVAAGHEVFDVGTTTTEPVDYPPICADVARRVTTGRADLGIVLGGSGQGEQIAANKVAGARAALCNDLYTARMSRLHNDANVLALGARIVAPELAVEILDLWLATNFEGGRHQLRVMMLDGLADGPYPSAVGERLLALAGGDRFPVVRKRSEEHQAAHGCGLHNAGPSVMALAASYVQASGARRVLDLGCGLGYSTLWLAEAAGPGAVVIGIDDDPAHIEEAIEIAVEAQLDDRISYRVGRVAAELRSVDGPVDAVHDDAWFATPPDHLDRMIELLRPGGLLTMPNWFLLIDALSGRPRNDWAAFAGPTWADDSMTYAEQLAARPDLRMTWMASPPLGVGIKL